MATQYDILPEAQRRLLPELAPLKACGCVLYGGTAIALHLGHRVSIDFDFFTHRAMDRSAMIAAVPALDDAEVLQEEPDAWTVHMRAGPMQHPVKVSFFSSLRFGRVGTPALDDLGEILIASRDDLLGHKLKVLLQRVEAKDYRDIAALLRSGLSLARGLGAARTLFPNFPPCEAIKALVYFAEGDLADVSEAERAILTDHVKCFTAVEQVALRAAELDLERSDG